MNSLRRQRKLAAKKIQKSNKRVKAAELFDWFEQQYFHPAIHDDVGMHWTLYTNGEQVQWWPGNNKWYFRNKTYSGDIAAFIRWITKTKP